MKYIYKSKIQIHFICELDFDKMYPFQNKIPKIMVVCL